MGYFKDAVTGVSWVGVLRLTTRGIALGKYFILGRILDPVQFGIFGIASLVLAFLEIITETGINVFLIQQGEDIKNYLNTAWVVSIGRGFVIGIVVLILGPLISNFFKSPEVLPLLNLIALLAVARGFINPAVIKFQKDLRFDKDFVFRFFIYFIDALVAVIVAYYTKSTLSFIWGMIAGVIVEIILSFVFIKPKPELKFESVKAKKVISRGKWLTAAGLFNYLFHQGDDIIIGRALGTLSLGYYQMAYKLSTFPITEIADVFGKVTFPVYVKIAKDKKRLKKAFIKTTLVISILTIPFGIILFLFSREIILIILGEKWLSIIPLIKLLTLFGIIRTISGSCSALFLAIKKQEYVTIFTLFSIGGLLISIFPLMNKFGLYGAAVAPLVGSLIALPVAMYYLFRVFR
ncbi:MAG: Membrane protein involved in the export of O-antigen and teichoic acid [Candidatus Woesebacteria bacterium GW2011_GWB1_38_5b]|uniref:Membrane protein involved in the export of O-antigen and teichoic acid n=1 Tax=Candidatus Woesebacteria bacterium GW2011_GWB1_38_5b TaxID=1618569 RepID=A0A0G0NFQ9_9BACT|nr:MAG: Membrane protein involved in the export of O-antigen and teichoic acid [Candidatus Woesebacteria bacterium GW2011_GWB1_38_5b]